MATIVRMPSVLAGATEAVIANWLVKRGDTVSVGTPVAEIETEKALVEYAAESDGIVGRLILGVGNSAEIGDPIAVLIADGETDADIDVALGVAPAAPAAVPAPSAEPAEAPAPVPAPTSPVAQPASATRSNSTASGGRNFASPLVRKVAAEKGIEITSVEGTGPNGRVVRRDLERFLHSAAAPAPQLASSAASPGGGGPVGRGAEHPATALASGPAGGSAPVTGVVSGAAGHLIPHTQMRRAIARRLTESKATVPHFYLTAEPMVDDLLALRKRVNEKSPVKVSVNDFVTAAVAAAFGDVPEANVIWTDEGLLVPDGIDLAIAVATETGLVTPVLRGVDGKKLSVVARESAALAQRARDRRLLQSELEGGTFAISNLGMYGTAEFSAIINPPQSGILAVGAARPQPVVVDGEVRVASVMRCTLSVDHRAIDGALAARWLGAFTARMEDPLVSVF